MADTVQVNTRKFMREFPSMKQITLAGGSVQIVEGGLAWRFELVKRAGGFLGATKGTLARQSKPSDLFSTGEKWAAEA